MTKKHRSTFDWNHISDKLTEEQINELKAYYHTYHRKCWAYKQAVKKFKRWKLLGNSLSVCFATGGIASAVATSGIALIAISTISTIYNIYNIAISTIIQGWMDHKDIDLKIQNCVYAYQSYQHLLNSIKNMMRAGNFNVCSLHTFMNNVDNYVTDNSPVVDKFLLKYDNIFTE